MDIGFGNDVVIIVYTFFLILAFLGVFIFIKRSKLASLFWLSTILNMFSLVYFMDKYYGHEKVYFFNHTLWPLINLALFILIIVNFIKNKYAKSKNK